MALDVRKGIPDPKSSKDEFRVRFFARFADGAFDAMRPELDRLSEIAWQAYDEGRKAPHTRPAGEGFADPSYDISLDWLRARAAVIEAQARHEDRTRELSHSDRQRVAPQRAYVSRRDVKDMASHNHG